MHVLGPHKRNVFNPMPNEEPRKDASLPLTHRQGGVESKTDLSALICLSATGKEVVRSSVVLRHGQGTTGDACGMSSTTTPSPRRSMLFRSSRRFWRCKDIQPQKTGNIIHKGLWEKSACVTPHLAQANSVTECGPT